MRFLVTGVCGQLGYDVAAELCGRGYECVGTDIFSADKSDLQSDLYEYMCVDITDGAAVEKAMKKARPDVVIHCAAWTNVDKAEDFEYDAYNVNVDGTKHIADACKLQGCKLMYISTDYIFNGEGMEPWSPDCDSFEPLNVYGESKLLGELAIRRKLKKYFIVRISWVFGKNGSNFVKTMLDVGRKYSVVRVVNDQIGTPTYTHDLARLLVDMCETEKYGVYHASNSELVEDDANDAGRSGYISWYDFCCEIYRQSGIATEVIPVTTEEYGKSIAKRPMNSRLDKSKLIKNGFCPLPDWRDALSRYLKEIESSE